MKTFANALLLSLFLFSIACTTDPLPSWYDTEMKQKIVNFVENEIKNVDKSERIAVFDMDGTIVCEAPLWLEMYCAIDGVLEKGANDPSFQNDSLYIIANILKQNPHNKDYPKFIDPMILQAYQGWDNEAYVARCNHIINETAQPDYEHKLVNTFYKPMLELLDYLKANDFDVYIVSGSMQGLIWSVCPQKIGFERSHCIGTRQQMTVQHQLDPELAFQLDPEKLMPKNADDGKALNIYSAIGKTPIFAFGNTITDFGMFNYASSNTLPNISFLLNHNDPEREYLYKPWHGDSIANWETVMAQKGWNIVNMKENFKTVFE